MVGDTGFLRRLYGETRAEEMASTDWPPAQMEAFLDSQFALQTTHYRTHYGESGHSIVELRGQPVGRLWLHDTAERRLLVDIALVTASRGQGLGEALVRKVQAGARQRGVPVVLHVLTFNAGAQRLYERLGFGLTGFDGSTHTTMEWRARNA